MTATVIARDSVGAIAENVDGQRFYATDCCGADATGTANYVGCRACYQPVPDALGGIPPPDRGVPLHAPAGDPRHVRPVRGGRMTLLAVGDHVETEFGPLAAIDEADGLLRDAAESNALPPEPDRHWVNTWLVEWHASYWKRGLL